MIVLLHNQEKITLNLRLVQFPLLSEFRNLVLVPAKSFEIGSELLVKAIRLLRAIMRDCGFRRYPFSSYRKISLVGILDQFGLSFYDREIMPIVGLGVFEYEGVLSVDRFPSTTLPMG